MANKRVGGSRKQKGCSTRSTEQKATDVAFCADLFLKGYTYREISDKLNIHNKNQGRDYAISPQTVYVDMKNLLIEWKRENMGIIDEYVTRECRKLDKMEHELWESWDASKKKNGYGSPQYFDLLLSVQQRRAKLLGLDKPVKIKLDDPKSDETYNVEVIPEELLYQVVDKLQTDKYKASTSKQVS